MRYLDKINAKNMYILFERPDMESDLWEKWALQLQKLGDQDKIAEHWAGVKNYLREYYIKNFVNDLFSDDFFNRDTPVYANLLKAYAVLRDGDYDKNHVTLCYDGKEVTIRKLSHYAPELAKSLPQILNARERNGHCHELAYNIVNLLQGDAAVVTGKVYGMSDKAGFFHSWVETKDEDGQDVVVDATLNAIYDRDDYYVLMHAEQLSAVTSDQIASDQPWLKQLSEMGYKQYLVFRHELARELGKKPPEFWEQE